MRSVSHAGGAHSDEDDQDYDDNDDKDEDSDDDSSDDENNSKFNYAPRDDEESDDNDSKCDSHRYSKFIDSLLLEDEEPPESYRVDWVKGKGAGRKANKGRPPQPDTTLMTADEAEEAIRKWEKNWKRDRDKLHRKSHGGRTMDGCSFKYGTTGYTGCISETFQQMVEVTNAPFLEGHTFPDKEIVLMRIVEEANLYGVWIKIIRSDGLQVDARGLNGYPFHVVAYYGTTAFRWKVTKCITWSGRQAYVPVLKGQKKGAGKGMGEGEDSAIPPLNVLDLPPPPPNEAVGDAFEDTLGGLEEGNFDEGPIPAETKIPVKMAKKPCTKSPIKEKGIVPLVHSAIAEAPNLACKEIMILPPALHH